MVGNGSVTQGIAANVADHAYDLAWRIDKIRPNVFANDDLVVQRVGVHPILLRHRLIDDHHWSTGGIIAVRKRPSSNDRDAENFKIAGSDGQPAPPAWSIVRPADDVERKSVSSLQRDAAGSRRCLNARQIANPVETLPHDLLHAGGLLKSFAGKRHSHSENVMGVEPRFDRSQREEGPDQEGRAD